MSTRTQPDPAAHKLGLSQQKPVSQPVGYIGRLGSWGAPRPRGAKNRELPRGTTLLSHHLMGDPALLVTCQVTPNGGSSSVGHIPGNPSSRCRLCCLPVLLSCSCVSRHRGCPPSWQPQHDPRSRIYRRGRKITMLKMGACSSVNPHQAGWRFCIKKGTKSPENTKANETAQEELWSFCSREGS